MHDSNPENRVLVFDSGLGALTVLREIAKARPDAELALVADDAGFPYGRLDDKALVDRVVAVLDRSIALLNPSLVVIACNTASTLALARAGAQVVATARTQGGLEELDDEIRQVTGQRASCVSRSRISG